MRVVLKKRLPTLLGCIDTGSAIDCQEYMAEKLVRGGYAVWDTKEECVDRTGDEGDKSLKDKGRKRPAVAKDSNIDTDGADGAAG